MTIPSTRHTLGPVIADMEKFTDVDARWGAARIIETPG
jgi:hypothetical protein